MSKEADFFIAIGAFRVKVISLKKVSTVSLQFLKFTKIMKHQRDNHHIGSTRLVVNLITINIYGFLFNCRTVGQTSDLMTTLM